MLTVIINQPNGSQTTFPAMRVDYVKNKDESPTIVVNIGNGQEALIEAKGEEKDIVVMNEHGIVVQKYKL